MSQRLVSTDPASGETVWEGRIDAYGDAAAALARARAVAEQWADTKIETRVAIVQRFAEQLASAKPALAETIARETGKPRWEAEQEVGSMIGKVAASIRAQDERAGWRSASTAFGQAVLRHRPHGVMAVLGPYNFPGHLPNGHIVPALLAGDVVVFKPSEEAPATGAAMVALWSAAGLPDGVLQILQGGRDTGAALIAGDIDGLLFTGSGAAGTQFRGAFADRPEVILALELGGNNPLVAWYGDPAAAASIIAQSAFVTTGQRCTCARRLVVPDGAHGAAIVEATVAFVDRIRMGAWNDTPEPAIGPLISAAAADRARAAVAELVAAGATVIRSLDRVEGLSAAFVTPAIVDVTGLAVPDEEIFAPVLQVTRVPDFESAIAAANATRYGLAAGLISEDAFLWERFVRRARAGVLNWNRPTTGAAGTMPFGGVGASGNHRPSAFYAADYCAYPVASFEASEVVDQSAEWRGIA
jgi:succinylglutamic semialdehyde dehydrogenase